MSECAGSMRERHSNAMCKTLTVWRLTSAGGGGGRRRNGGRRRVEDVVSGVEAGRVDCVVGRERYLEHVAVTHRP